MIIVMAKHYFQDMNNTASATSAQEDFSQMRLVS